MKITDETDSPDLREKTMELLLKWKSDFSDARSMFHVTEMIFGKIDKNEELEAFCRDMKTHAITTCARIDRMIVTFGSKKS